MKPTMYIANVGEKGSRELLKRVEEYAAQESAPVVLVSAALEAQIADMPDETSSSSSEDLGMDEPGLNRVVRAAYGLLGLQTYFTAGPKEGAPDRARRRHRAAGRRRDPYRFRARLHLREVASYDDFVSCGGEQGAKEKGKLRLEGKDYTVRDGDVIHFRFNV